MQPDFFQRFSDFYSSSKVGTEPNRLKFRHEILIERNLKYISGKRVLDLASHDGRWSMAALDAGADFVLGIEGRPSLVNTANSIFQKHGISSSRFQFITGEVLTALENLTPGEFDTIFCFGIIYHIFDHPRLFSLLRRLKPATVIFDTIVNTSSEAVIKIQNDNTVYEGDAIDAPESINNEVIVGYPSRRMFGLYLQFFHFSWIVLDWKDETREDWSGLKDYAENRRLSLVGFPNGGSASMAGSMG